MRKLRNISMFLFAVVLLFSGIPLHASANVVKLDYVALGDSLAAGQTPYKDEATGQLVLDDSYADFIAADFAEEGFLSSFTNDFAISGYKSSDVLTDIVNNVEKDDKALQDVIKEAEVITLSVGANDFLSQLNINRDTGTISITKEDIETIGASMTKNIHTILGTIRELNPNVQIYLMGYYNAFPHLPADKLPLAEQLALQLNSLVAFHEGHFDAKFVSVYDTMNANLKDYVPNPIDVHPSLEGYFVMAKEFLKVFYMSQFTDAPNDKEAFDAIASLEVADVLEAKDFTLYGTYDTVTRAEVAQTIYKLVPMTMSVPENPRFTDVNEAHPAYMAIAKLTEMGVFDKRQNFYPDEPITRAQLAKVLAKAFNLSGERADSFADVTEEYWAHPFIQALFANGITVGYDDGTFRPNQEVTRLHLALFLYRIMGVVE
ncbi:hypothetical protein EJF36_09880 [Bacillus sp. HMF5848]|uniref:S-layer homology domain-containing protein n=1 Tax=Bacillus sp. HMF5848 TaxID=2495421 RepID=UPI000F78A84E|nr:S-layer homology domain-containing protein [Bacillus sp. HMF5848]RSK27163.1 hypothetical protein EJF36_09880 [Bacillus sp. HMF5848]